MQEYFVRYFDYREILVHQLLERTKRNPSFSLRALARMLEIAPSTLSEVLNKKSGLSQKNARAIARKLTDNKIEEDYFCLLVLMEHARSEDKRQDFKRKAMNLRNQYLYQDPTNNPMRQLDSWKYLAIMEMFLLTKFKYDEKAISDSLGIPIAEVIDCTQSMLQLGLLHQEDGLLSIKKTHNTVSSQSPSTNIQKIHAEVLQLAEGKLKNAPPTERDFSSTFLAIDKTKLEEAREIIKRTRRELSTLLCDESKQRNGVFCYSTQFFEVTGNRA